MRLALKMLLLAVAFHSAAAIPAASAGSGSQGNCDAKLEKQAHDQPEPKDWNALYRLFRQFGACDEGAIGERFSADVAHLFSTQWSHLDTLNRLAAADKAFERFVLRHIDTTLDEDDLLHLTDNSKSRCPAGQNRICSLIHARAQESLDKQREMSE
jgi:hypothetical protein